MSFILCLLTVGYRILKELIEWASKHIDDVNSLVPIISLVTNTAQGTFAIVLSAIYGAKSSTQKVIKITKIIGIAGGIWNIKKILGEPPFKSSYIDYILLAIIIIILSYYLWVFIYFLTRKVIEFSQNEYKLVEQQGEDNSNKKNEDQSKLYSTYSKYIYILIIIMLVMYVVIKIFILKDSSWISFLERMAVDLF